ncbi:MAG TPA: hypothetical protein VH414_09170 [Lichenihabitans sp.]|jgi:hypothetical protein|nr:hypothetical protein [Lichenihabitans sp.]
MRRLGFVLFAAVVASPGLAHAEEAGGCAKFKWSIAREQAAFASPDLPSVESGQSLPGVMNAAIVRLKPQAEVAFEHEPARKPKVKTPFAAVLKLAPLAAPGTYEITLSEEAWIDVLQGGKEIRSRGFSGQADCPGVRKSVKFPLQAGDATVQISGVRSDSIRVDVLPVE